MARLNEQQTYLLNRLPRWYDVRHNDNNAGPEPPAIKRARKLISDFEDKQSRQLKTRESEFNRALDAAREAVYFLTPEKALAAIKKFEEKFGAKA